MKLHCAVLPVLLFAGTCVATAQLSSGRVNGTAAFVSEDGKFVEVAPSVKIEVNIDDLRGEFIANDDGDFTKRLPVGKYIITGVVGCRGQKLVLSDKQARTFEISSDGFMRLDVMIKVPEAKYDCGSTQRK